MLNARTITAVLPNILKSINVPSLREKKKGKVRDYYDHKGKRILITTDRISAFDRVLGYIPYKGQVLNQLSQFWFDWTKNIVENHLIDVICPNVSICHKANPYPVEMVVRGYITGVTSTSIWKAYQSGERIIYGVKFKDGLKKNQKLPQPIITPTTKAIHGAHDEKLTLDEILQKKIIPSNILKKLVEVSLELFAKGNQICNQNGLILVDTKYEFAEFKGKIMLIDEIHTPDSSRFWKMSTYQQRIEQDREPENFDKEFFRIWYADRNYCGQGSPPRMSQDLQVKTAQRYIKVYEIITGHKFVPEKYPLEKKIINAIEEYLRKS